MSKRLLCLYAATVIGLPACGGSARDPYRPMPPVTQPDPDCPVELACETIPAGYAITNATTGSYGNYDLANRPVDGLDIRYIVIHDTDTLYEDALELFIDPARKAATHYVIRSSDGHIAKMIAPEHVAWHAGNWYYNMHSIGIEHSGWAFEGWRWYSEEMYRASAKLVRYLADRYRIPLDRAHILGHEEIPGVNIARQPLMHWDPGPYWDWDHYMQLVRGEAPDEGPDNGDPGVIAIRPELATNLPTPSLTYCYSADEKADCRPVIEAPVNFVYLRTAPDPSAPLIINSYLPRTEDSVSNWANRAATGQLYYRVERQGEWDAIHFSGQKAWFLNTGRTRTRTAQGMVITPKSGMPSAPVYGVGYPADAAYMPPTLPATMEKIYELPAGQRYVATMRVKADYYWAKTYLPKLDPAKNIVVKDDNEYFQIDWNHRVAFVKVSDVDVVQ